MTLTRFPHAAVWLDHFHAMVVLISPDDHRTVRLDSTRDDTQLHRKSGAPGAGRQADDTEFFAAIAGELAANGSSVLVAGPSTAKHDFRRWLDRRHPDLAGRIVATETLDHPSEGELIAHARREFKRLDQLGIA